jgi:RNA-binding protein
MASSLSLSAAERKLYRGRAMQLKPAVIVGKAGASATVIKAIDAALLRDGLIKIRLEAPDKATRKEWLDAIANATNSIVCGEVGHTASLFRPAPKKTLS